MQRLNENLGKLTAKFEKATSDKLKCQQEAEATACTIALANRLVSVSRCGPDGMNGRYQVPLGCEPCAHSTLHPLNFFWNTFPALQEVSVMKMILHWLFAYIRVGTAHI